MTGRKHRRERHRPVKYCLATSTILAACAAAITVRADGPPWIGPTPATPQVDARSGGVLAHSYGYHRQSPAAAPTITPAGGWYGYGFPVQTYRWGWFGAAHYYPTVLWHSGYYGDQCRWAYRRGY